MDSGPLIRAEGLTKRYNGVLAVDDLSFHVDAGEIYGLLGPNGAGKTTTILMLLGLSEPTSGSARVVGLDPARDPLLVKRHVGYLPDAVGFYGRLTGRENLSYTARLNGMATDAAAARIDELLARVGLEEAADRFTDTYSRGMLQRLGVADALVKEPDVLILDEPTASIDPAGVAELLALIRQLVSDRGLAVLLSSHLLNQVERLCDRVGIFSRGRLIAEGALPEIANLAGDPRLSLDEVYRRLAAHESEATGGEAA
jgi:ABC-2 type transport system ATP-binding protein